MAGGTPAPQNVPVSLVGAAVPAAGDSHPIPKAVESGAMSRPTIPTIAQVECRSEGRGEQTPVAVIFGNERLEIVDVIDRAKVTSVEAGDRVRHRLWVELEDGRRCELNRIEPDGVWRVNVQTF